MASSPGTTAGCAVRGCTNTRTRLDEWLATECAEHRPATKRQCACPPPYTFHTTTTSSHAEEEEDEDDLEARMKGLDLKKKQKKRKPPQAVVEKENVVCSYHFVDKGAETTTSTKCRQFVDELMRTTEKAFPELSCLGRQERPPKRAKLETAWDNGPASQDMTITCPSVPPRRHDTQVQWEEPRLPKSTQTAAAVGGGDTTVAGAMLLDDGASLLLTGTRLAHFRVIVEVLAPFAEPSHTLPAAVADQILMTLMKLKMNLVSGELARRFGVSKAASGRVIAHWIDAMGEQLGPLVSWLPRETIQTTMPSSFKKTCPRTTCVVACGEIPVQRDQKTTDSSRIDAALGRVKGADKINNTAKYLVAVAPSGLIMFVSGDYDGRASDRDVAKSSGLLEHLGPGDEVMAGRGLAIRDLLEQREVRLVPAFPHRGGHVANRHARRVVNLHGQVEQAIGRLKCFNILSDTLPKSMTKRLAKILTVCAALANLREA